MKELTISRYIPSRYATLDFNGNSDFMDIPNQGYLNLLTKQDLTVAFWALEQQDPIDKNNGIVQKNSVRAKEYSYAMRTLNNKKNDRAEKIIAIASNVSLTSSVMPKTKTNNRSVDKNKMNEVQYHRGSARKVLC